MFPAPEDVPIEGTGSNALVPSLSRVSPPPSGEDVNAAVSSDKKSRSDRREVPRMAEGEESAIREIKGNDLTHSKAVGSGSAASASDSATEVDSSMRSSKPQKGNGNTESRTKRASTSQKTLLSLDSSISRLSACQLPPPPPEGNVMKHVEHYQRKSVQTLQNKTKDEFYHYFQRLRYPFKHANESEESDIELELDRLKKEISLSPGMGAFMKDTADPFEAEDMDKERVSALALSTFTDPVSGASVYSVLLGDMNGDIEYVEVSASDGNNRYIRNSRRVINETVGLHHCTGEEENDYQNQLTEAVSADISRDLRNRELVRRVHHSAHMKSINALNSAVVEPEVKCLSFVPNCSPSVISYLTANQRMIKLFRVRREGFSPLDFFPSMEQVIRRHQPSLPSYGRYSAPKAILPVKEFGPTTNSIQQLSLCADCQTFMSVQDLELYWWDMEASDTTKGSCIVDLTPLSGNVDEIMELVTAADFHPSHGSLFLMSRSTGVINIGDLRDPPCRPGRKFSISTKTLPRHNTFSCDKYDEILCSVCAASFFGNDYFVTRDYLSLKLWDLRKTGSPCASYPIMGYMFPYLDTLYRTDYIFERFPLALDTTSCKVIAGVYDNAVAVWRPLSCTDNIQFYRANPEDDPSDPHTSTGPVMVEELMQRVEQQFEAVNAPNNQFAVPSCLLSKVSCVDIAPGGERFAFASKEGKQIFVFETDISKGHHEQHTHRSGPK